MSKKNAWIPLTLIILFVIISVLIKAGLSTGFETWVYSEAVKGMSPLLTSIMKFITHLGDATVFITFCLLLFLFKKSRNSFAIPISITVIFSENFNILLKNIFIRQRPSVLRFINETGYSFPSGHAMNNAALYTFLILLVLRNIKSKPIKICLSVYFILITIAIGFSRVYLGVHYAGDVLGGWFLGIAIAIIIDSLWESKFLKNTL